MNHANGSSMDDKTFPGFVQIQIKFMCSHRTKVDPSYALFFSFMRLSFVVIGKYDTNSAGLQCSGVRCFHEFGSLRQCQYICVHCFSMRTIQWTEMTMGRICMDRGIELFHRIMKSMEIVWHLSSYQWAMGNGFMLDYNRANIIRWYYMYHFFSIVEMWRRRYLWNDHDLNHKSRDVFRFVLSGQWIEINCRKCAGNSSNQFKSNPNSKVEQK